MITNTDELMKFLSEYHRPLLQHEPPQSVPLPDIPIPDCLRLLHRAFGHHICSSWGPLTSQDYLISPQELRLRGSTVAFVHENQGCWSAYYDSAVCGFPVFCSGDGADTKVSDSIEPFLIAFALQEAVMSSPWLLGIHGTSDPADLQLELVELHRHARYVSDEPTHDFWRVSGRDVLCMSCYGFLWLASYTEDLLDLRVAGLEYQLVSPRDPNAPVTYVGRGDATQNRPSFLNRLIAWIRTLKR